MKVSGIVQYTAGFLYSTSGLGVVVAVPVAIVATITWIASAALAHFASDKKKKETYEELKNNCFYMVLGVLIAAIPIVGGPFMVHILREDPESTRREVAQN